MVSFKCTIFAFALMIMLFVMIEFAESARFRSGFRSSSRIRVRNNYGGSSARVRYRNRFGNRYRVRSGSTGWRSYGRTFPLAFTAGAFYGFSMSNWQRRRYYRSNQYPTVCESRKEMALPNGTMKIYNYIACPMDDMPDNYRYCCNDIGGYQACCPQPGSSSGGSSRIAGIVIGIIIILVVACIVVVYCKKRNQSQPGAVIVAQQPTTTIMLNDKRNETNVPPASYPNQMPPHAQNQPYAYPPQQPMPAFNNQPQPYQNPPNTNPNPVQAPQQPGMPNLPPYPVDNTQMGYNNQPPPYPYSGN